VGRQMQKGRTIAISFALAGWGCAEAANATSRFEAGEKSPVSAAVRIDFTIIIPEVLALKVDSEAAPLDSARMKWTISVPALGLTGASEPSGQFGLQHARATGNAGTPAVGTLAHVKHEKRDRPRSASAKAAASGAIGLQAAPDPWPEPERTSSALLTDPGSSPATGSLGTPTAIFLVAMP